MSGWEIRTGGCSPPLSALKCLPRVNSIWRAVDAYDRSLHTFAFRVFRAAHPHALSLSLRHREHDGRATSVRENEGDGGGKIFVWSQLGRLAAKMVHKKSRDDFRAGFARNAPGHQPRGEARRSNRTGCVFRFLARVVSPAKQLGGCTAHCAAAG